MSTAPSLPHYADIATLLSEVDPHLDPAQTHGLLCGYLSATAKKTNNDWEKNIFEKNNHLACRALLQELYEASYHQMNEFSFKFSLVLPEDNTDINVRTEALGLWCQGFLAGLEQCQISTQDNKASNFADILNDLTEIAQVNYGDIADSEENETAYFELAEYVRLSALMIFESLKATQSKQIIGKNDKLH